MRIGDLLYFAPGLRFDQVDIDGPTLPKQFEHRITGFYIQPAEDCTKRGHAFAAGVLLVSCIDASARLRFGDGVGKRFRKFVAKELPSFSDEKLAKRFYDEFRNGLVHEARLKNGGQFSLERDKTAEQVDGVLLVNPKYLAEEVRQALAGFVTLASGHGGERTRLAEALKRDYADDFRVAGL